MIRSVRTACAHDCPDQCSLIATVEDGRLLKLQGDPDHPMTAGFACAKVNREHEMVHSPERVLTPLRRTGRKGEGRFAPVTWDAALAEIVERWTRIAAEDGPLALLGYAYSAHQGQLNRGLLLGLFHAWGAPGSSRAPCATPAPRRAGTPRSAASAAAIRRAWWSRT